MDGMDTTSNQDIKKCQTDIKKIKKEISKTVVGQEKIINSAIKALLSNGHVLLEGVPGIGKTLLIRTLSKISGGKFSRIQFTVDLLPTDITGIQAYEENKGFYTVKGPIFANFVLADEVNRAPPKTQSALLEAMQEKQVTIAKHDITLPKPFLVMATQNPIEQEGVYNLPEAQKDRFLFKVLMEYPEENEEVEILRKNMTDQNFEDYDLKEVISTERILEMQKISKKIKIDSEIEKYIIKLVQATRKPEKFNIDLGKYIKTGGSPRASIGMFMASRADALIRGKHFVNPQNVKNVAYEVLRHRILINYEGEAEGIKKDNIIKEILSKVPVP